MSKEKKSLSIEDFLEFQKEQEGVLSITLAAQYSGYSTNRIHQLINEGNLPAFYMGKVWMVGFKSLNEYSLREDRIFYRSLANPEGDSLKDKIKGNEES